MEKPLTDWRAVHQHTAHLSEPERAEVVQHYIGREERYAELYAAQIRLLLRTLGEGVVTVLVPALALGTSWASLAGAVVVGVLIGGTWWLLRAERLLSLAIAMPAYIAFQLLWGIRHGDNTSLLFCGPVVVGCVSAYFGIQREER